nr:MAG TPA: hypothetical protein [Bacteriophage sp.]
MAKFQEKNKKEQSQRTVQNLLMTDYIIYIICG